MLGLFFIACNSGELTAFPSNLDWGEVDFREVPPEGGFAQEDISLTNTGTQNIDISLRGFDDKHLCLTGLEGKAQDLGTLEPEQSYALRVGVCDYIEEDGERDTLISGQIEITHTGANSPVYINWSFTPVIVID